MKDMPSIGYVVTDAAAAAIHCGKFDLALEWLEQGQSIIWQQMLQLRTPLDALHQSHPNEGAELERIARALDTAGVMYGHHHSDPSNKDAPQSLEMAAQAHRRLAEDHDRMLACIRNFSGFSEFLQPEKSASLCGAAISGPVVIVNAAETRCDALILLPHSLQVSHVPLPELRLSAVHEMQLQLTGLMRGANTMQRHYAPHIEVGAKLSDILARLWLDMVAPILFHLNVSYINLGSFRNLLIVSNSCCKSPHVARCRT